VWPGHADLVRRRAGVCLHLSSLPGPHGIGDLGAAARRFMDWMQAQSLSIWQFLPTGPTGFGNSPYQPLSVFAGNPLLIDLDALVEWGLLEREEADRCRDRRGGPVDYDGVASAKRPVLELAAERFRALKDSGLDAEYQSFLAESESAWLAGYAAFAVAKALNGGAAWTRWGASGRRQALVDELESRHRAELERAKIVQFFFHRQWRALRADAHRRGIVLFGDVPIYMALDCAEAWSHPELLDLDESCRPVEVAGVPPDYFSRDGQLWGNPLYRWDVHADDGFRWWIARLRHALAETDLVRLDHFRGFDEYWSVPNGARTAREGRWKPGPRHALFDALVAELGAAPFVAEDLGMITPSVTALRKAYALPGMQVLQFLVDADDFDIGRIEEDCVCYTGTHDNDTTEGWFAGSAGAGGEADRSRRDTIVRNLESTEEKVYKAMIYQCFKSAARTAVAPLQDCLGLGSEARLNTPGRTEGNWRWRVTMAELDAGGCDYLGGLVRDTGRA
jgi:4-alpha-glucanotransferase